MCGDQAERLVVERGVVIVRLVLLVVLERHGLTLLYAFPHSLGCVLLRYRRIKGKLPQIVSR